jgi:hypothetical protein
MKPAGLSERKRREAWLTADFVSDPLGGRRAWAHESQR